MNTRLSRDELLRLYPAERGRLVASLAQLVGPTEAEDLANETLLRALTAVDGFRGEAALGTWLHRIGVNLAYDLLRRRDRSPVLPAEQAVDEPEEVIDAAIGEHLEHLEHLEQRQMSQCVSALLAKLPAHQRVPLVQADMLDRTASEIAQDAGISVGNAKIRLHRARHALKVALETHCDFHHREAGVLCCTLKTER
ncbi:MAG: RNA polymerase sigma factor [Sterolibacterium sp.]